MTTREIVLDGGSPWGFRMHGGADVGQPLRISRVNPGSKAAQKGIREGDVISSINGQPTRGISNSDAHALLRNAGQTLHLGLNEECGGSPKRRAHRSSLQQQQEVTKHSSQQSTSRFPGSVNGGTDQNYNTVPSRGKDDASTEGVSSSESKGRRRQKQSAATQHSLAPPLQEESPGSSAVSSDVKEEPAASSSKPKKRKRNRKKNRAQQKIASAAAENGNASQTTASTDVSDVIQQTSSREEVDTSEFLEPSADGNISQSSTVVETPSRKVQEIDTSRSLEPSKDGILENISQSSAVSETNTAEQKSPQKDINISQSTEHLTSFTPTSSEIELMQQKSSEDVEELNTPKSSSSTAVGSSENILEENSLMSEIDVVRQTSSAVQSESIVSSSLTVSMKLEVHPESQLNSVSSETITQTNTSHQGSVNSGTEAHKICDESNDTNEQKGNHSDIVHQGVIGQDNSENSEETIPKKILDNISFVSPEKNIKGNNAHEAGITRNNTHVTANVHNAVFSQEELNAQRKQSNSVQEGEENSRESPKRDSEVAMLSNSVTKQEQATDKITGDSQRLSKTAVQVKSCQSSVECRAVVVETVDEEVWEEAVEFSIEGTHDPGTESCPLTSNTVSLQQYELTLEDEELLDPKPVIAAEEEETLRNFLYSLNLADYGRDSPRRGKRRSSHEVACNPVLHQRGLEVIMEENSSEISDSGDSKRGKGWKEAIYIPDTNEVIYLNEDSADEGEYTTEEASSKTESAMRSLYYAETTTTLTTEGTSSAEMREFIYRTVGETVKDDEDVFSAHMERMLEADAENGPQIIELVSEGEEDKEDVVSTQKTEEKQSGVEVVFVEDDTTSTSSGAPTNWEDVEDAPYEDVMFPVQGQPKYTHRREDSIYENMDINYERFPESEDDTVYENVDFTKRDAQDQGSFSTSSSEPRVSSRHLNCLVPPEQETSVRESPKEVQQDSDKRRDACNSSRQLTSSVPLEQEPSKGESLKQVKQGSDKQHTPSNSEPEVASRHLTSSVPLEQEPSKGESLKQVKQGSDKQHTPSNSEPEVASRHLTSSVPLEQDPSKGESLKQVKQGSDKQHTPGNSEPEVASRHLTSSVPLEQEPSKGESLKQVKQGSDKQHTPGNSEPEVASRHLTSSVPLEQEPSKGESLKQVKQGSDKQHTPSNSEPEVANRHLTSSVPLEQDPSKGESLKQVKQGSDKQHTPSNSEPEVASRHLTSSVPLEQDPSKGESPKKMQHEPDKQRIPSNFEPEVSSHNLDCMIAETTVVELMEQVQHANLSTSKPEPEISAQNQKCLIPETREFMGEFLQQGQDDIHHAGVSANIFKPQVSNLGQNCLVPPTVSEEETDMTVARSANEAELSNGLKNYAIPPIVLGRDISDNMVESNNHELEGQDAIEDGRDSITPTNNLSRRGSSSSDDTASHGTAFYCPVDAHSPALSSDADISSLTEEVPEARRKKVQSTPKSLKNPLSLKELCVAKVVTMPYGTYILNILGVRPHATPVRELSQLPERDTPVPCDEQWLATPTLDDPNLLVCLSPSQRKVYNEEVPSPDEMQTLLDLHCKFLQRRGYHEKPPPLPPSRKYRPLTSPRGVTKISPTSRSSSRLLAILREASEQEKVKPPPLPPPPDMSSCCKTTPPAERLKVRSLSDWLQLVRCAGGEANENTNGARSKDSTPPILSTQSSPGVVRRSSQLSSNHLVRCVDVGVNDKRNEARSKDSTPTILSTQSSPGTVRRSVPSQSENELLWYVDCSVNENLTDPTSPILSTQSSPGAFRRSVSCQRSFSEPEEEHVPQVPVRGQENYVRRSLLEPEEGHLPQAPFKGQENNLRHSLVFPEEKHRPSVVVQSQENHLRRSLLETEEEHVPSVPVRAEENRRFDPDNYRISKRGDIAIINSRPQQEDRSLRPRSLPPPSEALVTGGEIFRQQMYLEYMHKVAERSERRRQRVIRLSSVPKEDDMAATESAGGPLENEFMDKVRERMDKLGIRYDVEDGEAGRQNGVGDLPKHLQEFLALTDSPEDVTGRRRTGNTAASSLLHEIDQELHIAKGFLAVRTGVWSPSQKSCSEQDQAVQLKEKVGEGADDAPPVVWTPKSAGASPTTERKEFRPIKFESPTLSRKNRSGTSTPAPKTSDGSCSEVDSISTGTTTAGTTFSSTFQPWQTRDDSTLISSEQRVTSSSSTTDRRLVQSQSAPASGLSSLAASTKLPRAQNPTITLLQKAREGQLPKGALYLDHRMNSKEGENAYISPNEILYSVKKEYDSEGQNSQHKKIVELTPRKFEGIGPTTVEGVPTVLRSEIKDANQAKWYKRMYDSLHRAGKDDDYITIRYKTRKGQYPYTSPGGYLSEPEPACYDSDIGFSAKYATLDRRRIKNKENDFTTSTLPRSRYVPHPSSIKYATQVYKNQPGRIEDYEPGRSSISEKETKQWWDEVLDIFDGWLESYSPHHPTYRSSSQLTTKADATMYQQRASVEQQTNQSAPNKTFMAHALKDGYESDSTLVFKRRDENLQSQISPAEQKQAYKTIQKGGEVPLHGLRKPAPERPKDISEIEYFPISAHLTRIRVHKQHVTPLREIVCYPITASYNNNAVPPVFSTYKRTAPSYSQVQQTRKPPPLPLPPPPPSPPKRLSSHHSSALRLWTHVPRHRHEACFSRETNVSFLRDRLSHKLGVKLRTASSSPVASKTKATPRSRSAPEERQLGRKKPGQQEATAAWLHQAQDLSSPHEVRKALQRQKDVRERPGTKGLPPGTIIRSSTTPYASVRNSPHLPEDKSLKVTVAISPKARELLRPRAHASLSSLRTSSKSGTPSPEGTRSPSTSSPVSQTSGRAKTISSRSPSLISSSGKKTTKTTAAEPPKMTKTAALILAQDAGNRRVQKTNNKKIAKDKTPLTSAKTSASPKVCSKLLASKAKEEKETNRRKTKKVKTDGESSNDAKRPSGMKANSCSGATKGKANSTDKKKGQVAEKKLSSVTVQQNPPPEIIVSQQQGPLHTDSFFQHLLLRDMPSPTPSITSSLYRSSGVLDKVQKFHELVTARSRASHRTDASLGLLNVYLAQKKPVTESKFRSLEREHSRSPSPSYRSIRTRFSDLSSRHNTEDGAFYSFCPSRSRTPEVAGTHPLKIRSCSEPPPALIKSEVSYPAAVKREKPPMSHPCHSSVSSTSSRSPSYRRIRSAHCHGAKTIESIAGVKKKGPRAHSAGEAEARLKKEDQPLARSVSSLNVADHAEYQTYVMELMHSTKKSERFRELHNFYASLERLGQLEKTTSTGDLRPRLKGEEVIDFDRWKRLRTKERAEEELKILYRKLKEAQKEKDLLFQPKDVESVRWRGDRGLRCKEKSVEDLREQFGKLCREDSDVATKPKELDVYKPLWRGSSVLNLVSNLSSITASRRGRPVIAKEHYGVSKSLNRPPPGRYGRGIGCRLWSSLSMDQVNALKTQLNEIYSSVKGIKKDPDEFEIMIDDKVKKDTLHVRCNSLLSRDQLYSPMVRRREARRIDSMKADSISAMHHGDQAKPLSETEKKRLSLTLSQEVLDRVTKKHKRVSSPRETLGAIAAAAASPKTKPKSASPVLSETASPRTCYSLEMSEEDGGSTATRKNDFLLVLTPSNGSQSQQKEVEKVVEEWANSRRVSSNGFTAKPAVTTSTSETESASSDASTRTVIHRQDVSQKEEKTTRVSRSASDIRPAHQELTSSSRAKSAPGAITVSPFKSSSKLHSSQSFADLKEIFGEQSRLRYSSESPTRRCYSSPDSGRSGSLSPDTAGCRSWRSYLKMVKSGDVKRLKEKFESLEELCEEHHRIRKHKSDPELTRQRQVVVRRQEVGDVRWLRRRYETTCCRGRRRTRVWSPVLRHPIRLEDRFMPHINVISKTASLQQQSRSVTPTSLPDDGYHTGEVQKLKRKFETLPQLSLMGQMFTSTPDVRELRDIAPYLECHWVAHRFPDPGGGSPRSLSSPELRPAPPTPIRPRPSSSSPCTRSQPLSSILKQQQQRAKDIFANQSFDPSKHRPVYRYQPADVDWQRSRPTVTFKESPHRYVESEVTIHYRSPVRSEAKEALSEEELARRQAEAMRRIYQEERRRKYLQELQDMHSRRHTDNFTPSQKSPIPLNRYDDFFDDVGNKSKSRDRTPEPKLVARALYNFVGQTSRELSFRRGDIIFVRRQIDKNWYEGEHNAMVGLFPFNYVEIIPYDGIRTIPKRPTEGQARAKFNFIAQTHLELSLVKGELVVLTRRVDDNWFEGRIGNRKGIFPVSYIEVLQEPGEKPVTSTAPPSKPASHTTLVNGTGIKQSMGSHSYQPSFYYSHNKTSSPYTSTNPYATLPRQSQLSKQSLAPVNQTLHIDTHSEPVPYRALYNYRPQNEDELELCEGDTVYVMEKCDDGWYVGSSQRTGYFGTFPGNYVERI